jgi:hypothetical protein
MLGYSQDFASVLDQFQKLDDWQWTVAALEANCFVHSNLQKFHQAFALLAKKGANKLPLLFRAVNQAFADNDLPTACDLMPLV